LRFPIELQHNLNQLYIFFVIYFIYFVVHNLKILLLTINLYFIYIFVKASNIQYDQSRILNYTLLLITAYFTHCSYSIPEAVFTVVRAPDDECQHPKHVELPTVM